MERGSHGEVDQVRQNGKWKHDDKQQQSMALLKCQYIQKSQGFSLFIENIPSRMHWKWLWHLFARHGEVCRAFIARKLSRGGKHFGFVRFSTEEDAKRAMERLVGFTVYGFRLTVEPETQNGMRESSNWTKEEAWRSTPRIKVQGHVVVEELWKLQRCLVGEMSTICSVGAVAMRLEKWGLNGIKVHRMGGKAFLLSFEDEDLYTMLEDLNWSYLKEIFDNVEAWSEKMKRPHRETWIEVTRLPLHCWNEVTLKMVAEITTSQAKRIEDLIDVEIGNEIHEINVLELGFKDNSVDPLNMNEKQKVQLKKATSKNYVSSDSSSESVQSFRPKGGRDKDDVVEATFNALEDENEIGAGDEGFLGNMNSQKGKLTRRNSNSNIVKEKGDGVGPFGLNLKGSKSQSWADVVLKGGGSQIGDQRVGLKRVSSQDREEGSNVGLYNHEAEEVIKKSFPQPNPEADKGVGRKEITSVSWANSLDMNFNLGMANIGKAHGEGVSDGENEKELIADIKEG
ncbi:hypothetical protein GQ457_04G026450 [Hibiscus cannabinus]